MSIQQIPIGAIASRLLLQTLHESARPVIAKGTRVRLRNVPEITGLVLGAGFQPGDVRVCWEDTNEVHTIAARQIELAPEDSNA